MCVCVCDSLRVRVQLDPVSGDLSVNIFINYYRQSSYKLSACSATSPAHLCPRVRVLCLCDCVCVCVRV